jgi:2-polyprenyl-3-methyl-5-hydroxy-6-metoxy-1,4-benzoquinol methylase
MPADNDARILAAWQQNAAPWTAAVRNGEIQSRKLVTDQAIVAAVLARAPASVLDIGCGEGWLARALAAQGVAVTGVDAIPALIEQAQAASGGAFHVATYEAIAAGALAVTADVVVSNFALIGKEAVDGLVAAIPALLNPGGAFIVQTLHPVFANGDAPYVDGWRAGSWAGFSADFSDPAPWYFRTIGGWLDLFVCSGLRVIEFHEPLHPVTQQPLSAIFVAVIG